MKKELNGAELAGFIKERQAKQVRSLKQSKSINPKLVIVRTNPDPVVDSYMRLKTKYGEEIGIDVEVADVDQKEALKIIEEKNSDKAVHGIIVQIPLPDPSETNVVLDAVDPNKDVDGLGANTKMDAATPMAINWLLSGYNIDLENKHIVVVGHGRLVGKPLVKIWKGSGLDVEMADKKVVNLKEVTLNADILVSATGVPGLIKADMVKPDSVIVDAGVATDKNGLIGDVSEEVRELPGISITPIKGGVGPLTVCALFENVIKSARNSSE
ncbi:MAG: bifunctional 5,10-methylenetetrahydrofolate dehydrogenase/5,10-methenyltetrahydrofolate cyclohydrolase [bacterium]|nr:bifunctional 5,10-methylenetetrahydrofolate dehydrogenase/5,10-methenyltetrahydrofolate cyclohydrolase [bacterium]